MKKDTYYEFSLTGPLSRPETKTSAQDLFFSAGFAYGELAFFEDKKRFRICTYAKEKKKASKLKALLKKESVKGLRYSEQTLGRLAWRDKWMEDYKVTSLGKRFRLIPVWRRKEVSARDKKIPLFMEPRAAFGSGTHESTRTMIRALEKLNGKFKNYLDLGTGTGILSAAAFKLGAEHIAGIDNDPESVQTARLNLKHNGCKRTAFRAINLKSYKNPKKFDLVGANLFTDLLLKEQKKIRSFVKRGGYLAVSGVSCAHAKEFREGFKDPGFRLLKVYRGRKWMGFIFKRLK